MKLPSLMIMTLIGLSYAESNQKPLKSPNIVILMSDDMGFDDVSFHGNKQHITPNIDALAYHGMILNHLYTPPMCTPSRSAFMTGKYPFHTGTQHFVISNEEPWGLPLNITTMAEVFNEAGYSTNLIGKWHLGFSEKGYLPTNRGFDSHYGYLGGYIDYYSRKALMPIPNASIGYDFRRNLNFECGSKATYMTDLLTTEAEAVIEAHDTEKPLFLVVNHLAPHTGNQNEPLQAPKHAIEKFNYIEDEKRRVYAALVFKETTAWNNNFPDSNGAVSNCLYFESGKFLFHGVVSLNTRAMISKLDESIGNITKALDQKQILNNTIIIFYSDNGAPSLGFFSNTGSNYPMRGQKNTPWEGGVRVAGAIWSPLLKTPKTVFNQKISVVDWLPTLASAADVQLSPDLKLDGLDLWNELSSGNTKPFDREIVHVLDDINGVVSLMSGGFKYINGTTLNGLYDSVLITRSKEQDPRDIDYANTVLKSTTSRILTKYDKNILTESEVNTLRGLGEIQCGNLNERVSCNPVIEECLFNINEDPCEENNLASLAKYEAVLNEMRIATEEYRSSAVKPANRASLPEGDPSMHECTWTWFEQLPSNKTRTSYCTNEGTPCQES